MSNTQAIRKQLVAAIIMVLVAAIALGASTYAWFVNNNTVQATGMQVQAEAENGIVIANSTKANYASSAATAEATDKDLIPVSTKTGAAWFHAKSDAFDDAKAGQSADDYESAGTDGTDYVKNTFYIKSSGASAVDGQLKIDSVTVTSGGKQNLSSALRVGIMVNNVFTIYAPVAGYTTSYYVGGDESATVAPIAASTATTLDSSVVSSFPANTADGIQVDIYMWYEGEDQNCKSSNLSTSLEQTMVTVTFDKVDATA